MPEMKNNFQGGKMNKDLDERLVPNSEYRDALNVEIATSNDSDMGALQTLKGNTFLGGTEGVCIGSIADDKNDKLYFMVAGINRDSIIEYDYIADAAGLPAFAPVCIDAFSLAGQRSLNFNTNFLITGINIIDDTLFWTDNNSEPKRINITRGKAGSTDFLSHTVLMVRDVAPNAQPNALVPVYDEFFVQKLVLEKHLTVIKKGPPTAPTLEMIDTLISDIDNDDEMGGDETIRNVTGILGSFLTLDGIISTGSSLTISMAPDLDAEVFTLKMRPDFPLGSTLKIYAKDDKSKSANVKAMSWAGTTMDLNVILLSGNPEIEYIDPIELVIEPDQPDPIFQFKFPRFAYRYKYEDGEYSTFSPFTEPAFLPGRFNYLPKEGYNLGMVNRLRKLVIKDFVHIRSIGEDVISIDILYKDSNSPSIYSISTIKKVGFTATTNFDEWNGITATTTSGRYTFPSNRIGVDGWCGLTTGYFPVTTEMIRAVLPSNQLLRPWDNVPRKALAQEVIGNRLVYGNYLQNYDLKNTLTNNTYIKVNIALVASSNDVGTTPPEEIHAGGKLPLRYSPAKSIKSLRTYQVGVVYIDRYGRETPVFSEAAESSSEASTYITKPFAQKANQLNVQLKNSAPDWATHYKFFIKETSNEYYNLAMDRWYNAEDGNIWISFPSAERNKVDEETFLILKKEHDTNIPVSVPARYKIIAIENEAPRFIKIMNISMGGIIDTEFPVDGDGVAINHPFGHTLGGFPLVGGTKIWVEKVAFEEAGWKDNLVKQDISQVYFRVTSIGGTSLFYRLKQISFDTSMQVYVLTSGKVFGDDMGHTSPNNTHNDRFLICQLQIIKKIPEDKAEFEGRFFVKILKDAALIDHLHLNPPVGDGLVCSTMMPVQYIAPKEAKENSNFDWDGYDTQNKEYDISIDSVNKDCWAIPSDMNANTGGGAKFWSKASKDDGAGSGSSGWFIDKVEAFRPFSKNRAGWKAKDGDLLHRDGQNYWNHGAPDYNAGNNKKYVRFTPSKHYKTYLADDINKKNSLQVAPIDSYNWGSSNDYLGYELASDFPVNLADHRDGGKTHSSLGINKSVNIIHLSYSGLNSNTSDTTQLTSTNNAAWYFGESAKHELDKIFIEKLMTPGTIWRWKEDPDEIIYQTVIKVGGFSASYWQSNYNNEKNDFYDGEDGIFLYNYAVFSDYLMYSHHTHKARFRWTNPLPWGPTYFMYPSFNAYTYLDDWASRDISDPSLRWYETSLGIVSVGFDSRCRAHYDFARFDSLGKQYPTVGGADKWLLDSIITGAQTGSAIDCTKYDRKFDGTQSGNWPALYNYPIGINAWGRNYNRRRRFTIYAETYEKKADGTSYQLGELGPSKYLPTNPPELAPHFDHNHAVLDPLPTSIAPGIRPDGMFGGPSSVDPNPYSYNDGTGAETRTEIPMVKTKDADGNASNVPGSVTWCILEQFEADPDNFSSTNPAIFETEPKEDVGLDIYHEVGQIYPVDLNDETIEQFVGAINKDVMKNSFVECTSVAMSMPPAVGTVAITDIRVVAAHNDYVMLGGVLNAGGILQALDLTDATHTAPVAGDVLRFWRADGSTTEATIQSTYNALVPSAPPLLPYPGTWYKLQSFNLHNNPIRLPWFNCYSFGNGVESDRIRDDYNQITIDNGPKASTTIEEPYLEERRKNGFIWSGLYNSTSGINNTNQFIQAEKITKDVNPTYGSIQKLHARDSDLVAFCEDRVLKVLANKDALYNADGNTNLIATDRVLGAIKPFVGDYGISLNPESFASDSHRVYFSDTSRGAVLRLSQDGITNISNVGMQDWFADRFSIIGSGKVIGSFDDKKGEYNITLRSLSPPQPSPPLPCPILSVSTPTGTGTSTGTGTASWTCGAGTALGFTCYDPGDGSGPHATLSACQAVCFSQYNVRFRCPGSSPCVGCNQYCQDNNPSYVTYGTLSGCNNNCP